LALKEKISTFFSGSFSSFCFLLVEEETSGMFGLLGLGQNADPPLLLIKQPAATPILGC